MSKIDAYRTILFSLVQWDNYLLQESGSPGPHTNLDMAYVVAEMGDEALFERYLAFVPEHVPADSPGEFLAFCGTLGLGK
jgi:hypothetical protein